MSPTSAERPTRDAGPPGKVFRYVVWLVVAFGALAVLVPIICLTFLFRTYRIPSGTMAPTILAGDHILVNKFVYGFPIPFTDIRFGPSRTPERGDVIVFVFPEDRAKDFVKRVVAIGGDTIEIRDKMVFLNGKELDEPYVEHKDSRVLSIDRTPRDNLPQVTVPEGRLFVMGDNRDFSYDSRFWGFLPLKDVKSQPLFVYYSVGPGTTVRWERLFKWIQ